MITSALRSLWKEPRAADPPGPGWADWLLVAAAMAAALIEGTTRADVTWRPIVTIVAVGLAVVLPWRRTNPLLCLLLGFGGASALGLAGLLSGLQGVGLDAMVYLLIVVYALVRWGAGREIVIGLAVVSLAAATSAWTAETGPVELLSGLAVLVAVAAAGAAFRFRAESARRALAQIRGQERVSLARELHDTVAHHVSAIVVQAQAGQAMAEIQPQAAVEALAVIEGEASRTLAEMRSMVRVLRDGAPAQYGPQQGIVDLARLARSTPNPVVKVELVGDLPPLTPQVDAAVYRMAQEAVTNALRHGSGATLVAVTVVATAGWLTLRIIDDGRSDLAKPAARGFGLLGMTERAQLLGGTLRAGPQPDGGWAVVAELPTELSK